MVASHRPHRSEMPRCLDKMPVRTAVLSPAAGAASVPINRKDNLLACSGLCMPCTHGPPGAEFLLAASVHRQLSVLF